MGKTLRYGTVVLLALLMTAPVPTSASARESTCPELIKPQVPMAAASGGAGRAKGSLQPVDSNGNPISTATLTMDFGTNRERDARTQTFEVKGVDPGSVRVSTVNDIVSGNNPLPISHQQLTYRAGVDQATGLVNVRVCYDPGGYHEPDAGRYVGALLVSAPGAKPVPLAIEFTVRDDAIPLVILALAVGILAGTAVLGFAAFQQAPKETRPSGIWPYLFNFRALAAFGTGVVAGFGAYGKLFAGDPTWNLSAPHLVALAGATFAATLAAKTFLDMKGPTEKEKDQGLAA